MLLVIVLHFLFMAVFCERKLPLFLSKANHHLHLLLRVRIYLWICLEHFAFVSVLPNHCSWEDVLLYEKVTEVLIDVNIFMHIKTKTLVLIAVKSNHVHLFIFFDHFDPICSGENER